VITKLVEYQGAHSDNGTVLWLMAGFPAGLLFRVAAREVESWRIADRDALAASLGIPGLNFSADPDSLDDPKAHLLGVIRAKGMRKFHRDMLPGPNSRLDK
jgi:hypothetical protein